ncbi:MAG: TylF/MycF/NovP-related O-methyltransferase [Fimbriimonadaceae bacterium]
MGIKGFVKQVLASRGYELQGIAPEIGDIYDQDGLRTKHNHDFVYDPRFVAAYERGLKATGKDYRFHWRVHVALWAAEMAAKVPGDFVECGVNKGFMSSAMMQLLDWNSMDRMFWLLDTFDGIDERFLSEEEKASGRMGMNDGEFYVKGVELVRENFSEWERVEIVVGAVPETLPKVKAEQVAFLHLDMNCAPPEVAALEHFWPLLSPGGVVLMDDYTYSGYEVQHKSLRECAARLGTPILGLPTGQGVVIKSPI